MSSSNTGNFLSGIAVGLIIGAIVGLLLAPQSGSETREMLRQKAEMAKQKASELAEKLKTISADVKET